MHHPILYTAGLIRQYLSEVCFGMTAVAIMLCGPTINRFILGLTKKFHWLIRYLVLVLLCTFGYGFLTQVIYRNLKHGLSIQHSLALVIITIAIYLALAFFARKQGHI